MTFLDIPQIALTITVKLFLLVIFSLAILRQILFWVWLWQLKEYRIDRFDTHLEMFPAPRQKQLLWLGYYALKKMRWPRFTQKATAIAAALFVLYALFIKPLATLNISIMLLTLILLYLLVPVFVWIMVDIMNMFTAQTKEKIIKKASEKMRGLPDLLVIGITGSYGKSTTKEILAELLDGKFKVLKTPANINTPVGVARLIVDKLERDHQFFIVEMGAYKTGEIKEICDIVKPRIGILTGINEQHLALFGNIRNTINTKFELIRALPPDGLAVLNQDNSYIKKEMEMLNAIDYGNRSEQKAKVDQPPLKVKNIIYYSAAEPASIYATEALFERNKLSFTAVSADQREKFETNLLGAQNIGNILAAAGVALYFGLSLPEISRAVAKIPPREKSMKEYEGINGIFLIDDTYNSNPDGVLAALDYINAYSGKKFIVFGGIIELGTASREIHEKIGQKIAAGADLAVLTNPVFARYIMGSALANNMRQSNILIETNPDKIFGYIKENSGAGDVVLFAGRGAEQALEKLKVK